MRLFPFRQPVLGLGVGDGTLGLVEVRRGWRKPSLRRCAQRALPAGLLRLSAVESNVADVPALAQELSALLDGRGAVRRPVPVALSLPDLCARVALCEFDTLPKQPSELDALIRWRFQKDLNVPVTDTRFTYQSFSPLHPRLPSVGEKGGIRGEPIRVLAVSIRTNVIEPYEQACESAGLIPVSVGLASLQLFDLCRPALGASLKTAAECFYLYVGEGSFAFLAIQAGVPVFLRNKPLRNGSAAPHDSVVLDELLGTLQFYMEHEVIAGKAPATSRPLFVVNGHGMVPAVPDSFGVTVVPIEWNDLPIVRQHAVMPPFVGLPAIAGVMEG